MPYREIVDDDGVWIVFSTQPRSGANVRSRYADGWLSFHRGSERRRLAPIPDGWDHAADDQMRTWLRGAEHVARTIDDDEGTIDLGVERRRIVHDERDDGDDAVTPAPEAVAAPADPASAPPASSSGPAARVQKSIERIRAMLSDIRPDR